MIVDAFLNTIEFFNECYDRNSLSIRAAFIKGQIIINLIGLFTCIVWLC